MIAAGRGDKKILTYVRSGVWTHGLLLAYCSLVSSVYTMVYTLQAYSLQGTCSQFAVAGCSRI